MKASFSTDPVKDAYRPFSKPWHIIVQTRLLLCTIVTIFILIYEQAPTRTRLLQVVLFYAVLNVGLGLFPLTTLRLKRIRFIPDAVDVLFISVLLVFAGPASSWFVFYLFPIASVARYAGEKGSLGLGIVSAILYFFVYVDSSPDITLDSFSFALRICSFIGVAAVAGNLARTRQRAEMKLVGIAEEVSKQILKNLETEEVFKLILKRSLQLTGSDMGHLRLVEPGGKRSVVAAIGHPEGYDWELRPLDDSISEEVIRTKKPKIIPAILKRDLARRLGTYFTFHRPRPRSALFFPVLSGETVAGVIAVYSRRRFHYTRDEIIRLGTFTPLVVMAQRAGELSETISKHIDLQKRISSEYDIEEVLALVCQYAREIIGAYTCHIRLFDPQRGVYTLFAYDGPMNVQQIFEPSKTVSQWFSGKVAEENKPKVVVDLQTNPEFLKMKTRVLASDALTKEAKQYLDSIQTAYIVPLTTGIFEDEVDAILNISSEAKGFFIADRREAIDNVATQAKFAIAWDWLRTKRQEVHDDYSNARDLLVSISEKLRDSASAEDVYRVVLSGIADIVNPEMISIFIFDPETGFLEKKAESIGDVWAEDLSEQYAPGQGLIGSVFRDGSSLRLNVLKDGQVEEALKEIDVSKLPSQTLQHYLAVPLKIWSTKIGVIRAVNKKSVDYGHIDKDTLTGKQTCLLARGFSSDCQTILGIISSHLAIALQYGLLYTERYLKNIVDNSPEPIIFLDADGNVKVFNRACEELWGYKGQDVIGTSVVELYGSETQAKEIGLRLWEGEGNQVKDVEIMIRISDGQFVPVTLSASFLFNEEHQRIGSVGVFKDLREIKRLRDLAEIGGLAKILGHDIKSDIATALNYSHSLTKGEEDPNELPAIYLEIEEALWSCTDKIQNLLMAVKPKAPVKEPITIQELIAETNSPMSRQAKRRHVQFAVNLADADSVVRADLNQMSQVFWNLFGNSMDAIGNRSVDKAHEPGRIEVLTVTRGDHVLITWTDNGCGIGEKDLPNIFESFFTTKRQSGTGLGLATVKTVIDEHAGRISVSSKVGEGTSFSISLPLLSENDSVLS